MREDYFFLIVEDGDELPAFSVVIMPLPNGRVVLLEPSERFVIVPEPNFCVVPVTVFDGESAAKEQFGASRITKATASSVEILLNSLILLHSPLSKL